jgi:hypothetical protein
MNPRSDGAAATFERLKEAISKRAAKDRVGNLARYIGRPAQSGYYIVAADGPTALLGKGPGSGEYCTAFDSIANDSKLVCSIVDPEFHNVIKRALVMGGDSRKVQLLCSVNSRGAMTLKIASSDPEVGSFCESMESNAAVAWHTAVDGKFLEQLCGIWPLHVWYQGPAHAVMFEPAGGEFRYIVMPFKDTLTESERADLESVDYEPVLDPENPKPAADSNPVQVAELVDTKPEGSTPNMGNKIPCPQCGSSNTQFYDGALGYEAVRCLEPACFEETDLNNDHAHQPWKEPVKPAAMPAPDGSEAYQLAYAKHGAAAKVYRYACQKYRGKVINDREFLAARAVYDAVVVEFDKALEAEQNKPAKENPKPAADPGPTFTRMIIGECISADQVRAVSQIMQNHLLGCSDPIGARVLAEEAGNMIVMEIEFRTRTEALAYYSTRWYRELEIQINHMLVGSVVHRVFQNKGGL